MKQTTNSCSLLPLINLIDKEANNQTHTRTDAWRGKARFIPSNLPNRAICLKSKTRNQLNPSTDWFFVCATSSGAPQYEMDEDGCLMK